MKKTAFIAISIFLFITSHSLFAREVFFDDQATGWHWYEAKPDETITPESSKQKSITPGQAISELESLQEELEGAKALAILYPTQNHIENYIALHNTVLQKASLFSKTWQQVLWQTPELDFSLQNPTDNSARHVYHDNAKVADAKTVKALSDEYGLFFFFRSDCPYCHAFAPILKRFEESYGITVMAIALDGGALPEYPDATPDNGIANQLGINVVPAVVALHPQSQQVIPMVFGLVSEEELLRRMSTLARVQGEKE